MTNRLRLAKEYARLNQLNRVVGRGPDDVLGVVAAGHTFLDVLAVLRRLGIGEDDLAGSRVRLLRVAMPWPLEETAVREFADGLDEILVVEEKRSFLEAAIRDILYGGPAQPAVTGKTDTDGAELIPAYGELDADAVIGPLRRRMTARGLAPAADPAAAEGRVNLPLVSPLASRVPYFCSGCPHNSSTKPLPGTLVGAGIGCHALVMLMDEEQAGTVTGVSQMGGEGMQWIGMAPFLDRDHFTQNIGDGTFDHSGSLAIRAAIAAQANMTYKLLYNRAVAMTGGQRPASGMTVPQIVRLLLAEGVAKVIVTTEDRSRYKHTKLPNGVAVWDRSRLDEAQRVLAATRGVTVLVHDQECATEKRRKRKRGQLAQPAARVFINERICEGCGDCGRTSNCLSVQPVPTEFGRKTRIHQSSCNVDYSCLDGDCPAFMTVVPRASGRGRAPAAGTITADELPAPHPVVTADSFGIRLCGVGGTGVVTVSQVLATAGLIAGWHARSLDQTGLAQKGGAVVSDVRFSRSGQAPTNKLGAGECDLYLGCDLLVAADPKNLTVTGPDRTVAVISVAEVPSGPMVSDPRRSFPDRDAVSAPITARVRDGAVLADVRQLVTGLFGDDQFANVFLVGAGFQAGALPLPPDAIEEALRVNGVAVEKNIQAFRRGRQYIADPAAVLSAAGLGAAALDGPAGPAGGVPARPADQDPVRGPDGVPGPGLRSPLPRRGRAGPRRGTGPDAGLGRPDRGRRPLPVQAHGLQGRVRGGQARPGAGPRRRPGRRVRAGRPRLLAAAPAGPARPGHEAEDRARPVVRPRVPGPAGHARGAGHLAGPVRPHPGPGHRARADRGVHRPRRPAHRPAEPGPRRAGRAAGRTARPGARLRGRETAQRRVLPPVPGRAPRPARRVRRPLRLTRRRHPAASSAGTQPPSPSRAMAAAWYRSGRAHSRTAPGAWIRRTLPGSFRISSPNGDPAEPAGARGGP